MQTGEKLSEKSFSLEIVRLQVIWGAHPPIARPDHLRPVACLNLKHTILLRMHDASAVPNCRATVARAVVASDVIKAERVVRTERVGSSEDVDSAAFGTKATSMTKHGVNCSLPSENDRRLVPRGRRASENSRGIEGAGREVGGELLNAHVGGLVRQTLRPPDGVYDVGNTIIDKQVEIAKNSWLLLGHRDVAICNGPRAGWARRGGRQVETLGVRCRVLHVVHPPAAQARGSQSQAVGVSCGGVGAHMT